MRVHSRIYECCIVAEVSIPYNSPLPPPTKSQDHKTLLIISYSSKLSWFLWHHMFEFPPPLHLWLVLFSFLYQCLLLYSVTELWSSLRPLITLYSLCRQFHSFHRFITLICISRHYTASTSNLCVWIFNLNFNLGETYCLPPCARQILRCLPPQYSPSGFTPMIILRYMAKWRLPEWA